MEELNDKHQFFNPYKASCQTCRKGFDLINFTCKAFPAGIPVRILTGNDKHLTPEKGQENSIVYSPKAL
jgi:hypothetical protein